MSSSDDDHRPEASTPGSPMYPPYRPWLAVLSALLILVTFGLIALGGHVTSEEAGMSVPDGFTTFGTWSLIAPLETWWYAQDTRLEHTHRLAGYAAGFLAIATMVGFLVTQGPRRWLKVLGVVLLLFVIFQGVLGILRVDEVSLVLAGIHGVTGQIFLCLTVLAAAAVGRYWMTRPKPLNEDRHRKSFRFLPLLLLALLLFQLIMGSAVRHSHSAMAIPDWPTHYGQLMPPMEQAALDRAIERLPPELHQLQLASDGDHDGRYGVWQVHLHLTHRLGAYVTLVFGLGLVWYLIRVYRGRMGVVLPAALVGGLLLLQVMLGVYTVWSGERPFVATLHQSNGALLLATATWLTIRLHLTPRPDTRPVNVPVAAGDATTEKLRVADQPRKAASTA